MKLFALLAAASSVDCMNIFADELANFEARFGPSNLQTFRSRRQRQMSRSPKDKVALNES